MTAVALQPFTSPARRIARGAFVALGISIPISTALDGVLLGVIVLAWLLANRFSETAAAVRSSPVAAAACLWFAAHVLGALYSIGEAPEIMRSVGKAAMFLIIPVAIAVLNDAKDRERALYAFMAAIALTVVLSSLRWGDVIPAETPWLKSTRYSATVVFKLHLTQNLLVAFGAFIFAVQARRATRPAVRFLFWGFTALAVVNVMVMGDGRTGQLVLLVLSMYYGAWCVRRYKLVAALAIPVLLGTGAYLMPDSALHKRATLALSEGGEWRPGVMAERPSPVGERLEFYRKSLDIAAAHPLAGVGTGGFIAAYERAVRGTTLPPTHNPHNEYLLKAVELGVIGVALLLGLLAVEWLNAGRLADAGHTAIAHGLVLTIALASLFTTPLNDHTELLLFVWLSGVLFSSWAPPPATSPAANISVGASGPRRRRWS